MKHLLSALICLLLVGSVQATEIAVVDFRAALLQSDVGQKAAEEPKKQIGQMNARMKKEQDDFDKMVQDLKRDELTLSAADLKSRREALVKRQNELRSMGASMQHQAQEIEKKLIESLTPKGKAALEAIIKEKKLDLVLNREMILYAGQGTDITAELIKKMNEGK